MPAKRTILALLSLSSLSIAHSHGQEPAEDTYEIPVDPNTGHKDWASWHMHNEHHIQGFDAQTFFTLHDPESTGIWTSDDIRRFYGLEDKTASHIPEAEKATAVQTIMNLFDADKDNRISRDEFVSAWNEREIRLPDLGMGPGHHGDDEYEYTIHHWEKYHSGEDVKEEDLIHPEDIEHFKLHEKEDQEEEDWEKKKGNAGTVVENNIPGKYLRDEF
jgi:hypothetical protein